MPRQPIVYASNTMDFWRQSINGLAANINFAQANTFMTSGNVVVNVASGAAIATLNIANGTMFGNGLFLRSLNALSFLGTANNSKLQNTSVTLISELGISGNISVITFGQSVSLNISVVDSVSNTRTDLPVSANAIQWAMARANTNIANATLITTGIADETRGGTGEVSFANGELLIGNTQSGKLNKSTLIAGQGIVITNEKGSIRANLNIVQGNRMTVAQSGSNGAVTITGDAYESGSTSQIGIIRLEDSFDSTSITLGVTANAVNAVSKRVVDNPSVSTALGRLVRRDVYTTSNTANRAGIAGGTTGNTRYTWTKSANVNWVKIIAVGGGGAAPPVSFTAIDTFTGEYEVSGGGGSGATVTGIWSANDFSSTETVQVGGGGPQINVGSLQLYTLRWWRNGDWSGFLNGLCQAGGGTGGQCDCSQHKDASYVDEYGIGTSIANWATQQQHRVSGNGGVVIAATYINTPLVTPYGIPGEDGSEFLMLNDFPRQSNTDYDGYIYLQSPSGGSTPYGRGGAGNSYFNSAFDYAPAGPNGPQYMRSGSDGEGYGSGGGGGLAVTTFDPVEWPSASNVGGNGAPGIVIVEQYTLN